MKFSSFGVDERLVKAIGKIGWSSPTPVQQLVIPNVLSGKDVIAQARTGSGKTGAYLIPFLHTLLTSRGDDSVSSVRLIILAPSKELCGQIVSVISVLLSCCHGQLSVVDVSPTVPLPVQKAYLSSNPDIIVGTPSRILAHLAAKSCSVQSLRGLVIDEADLLFSFGFGDELRELVAHLPPVFQAFITSATLSSDVKQLKGLYLQNSVSLTQRDLDALTSNDSAEGDSSSFLPPREQLEHYQVTCGDDCDKYVLLVSMMKLNLLRGRTLVFVNTVDRAYRLRLVLEQFGLPTAVLNPELPASTRVHTLEHFNSGRLDRIVACDMTQMVAEGEQTETKKDGRKRRHGERAIEMSVSRGIDFEAVTNVVNFDFPTSMKQYVHRVGRTARGTRTGTALSFLSANNDSTVFDEIQQKCGSPFRQYQLRMEELAGFRYRVRDAVQAATRTAVREARLAEIKRELMASDKLKRHFAANPRDMELLRHDKALCNVNKQPWLRNIPDYIVPKSVRRGRALSGRVKRPETAEPSGEVGGSPTKRRRVAGSGKKGQRGEKDALKSMRFYGEQLLHKKK